MVNNQRKTTKTTFGKKIRTIIFEMEVCKVCLKKFQTIKGLHRHMSTVHRDGGFPSDKCTAVFSRKDKLKWHKKGTVRKTEKHLQQPPVPNSSLD